MININQAEFIDKARNSEYTIVDVRSPEECASGVIGNAQIINLFNQNLFLAKLDQLDKTKPYLVYCRSGNRSAQACTIMDSMGFTQTYNLIGGVLFWDGDLAI